MAVTAQAFRFARYFPTISVDDIQAAIDDMSVQFSGTQTLWHKMNQPIRDAKRDLLLSLIVAWYLADTRPNDTEDIMNNAGMPLVEKENAGVTLKFLPMKVQESMYPFLTNTFGIRALSMIMSAPERFKIYGNRGWFFPAPPQGIYGPYI